MKDTSFGRAIEIEQQTERLKDKLGQIVLETGFAETGASLRRPWRHQTVSSTSPNALANLQIPDSIISSSITRRLHTGHLNPTGHYEYGERLAG